MSRIVDKNTCINCGACEPPCPVGAISEVDNVRYIDPSVCIDCGACDSTCPVSAISVM
jgi:NAD-dependent dihydropyrimidine dehydrogenase PreA subunit